MSILFIISAPSGSGKSTLVNKLRKIVPHLRFSISYTTRPPRGNEQNGREYYFVTRLEFAEMIRQAEFLEYAEVHDHCYGTAKRFWREAQQDGEDLLLDIDVQGAAQIKGTISQAISIFILPPDRKTLEWRLRSRGLDTEPVVQRRLYKAAQEIENYNKYDYILVNDLLEDSVEALKAIVLAVRSRLSGDMRGAEDSKNFAVAEQYRLENVRERVQPILASFVSTSSSGAP